VRSIHVPIVAFAGRDDTVVPQSVVREWERFAASAWELRHIPGGHFFIQTHAELVMSSTFDCLTKLNEGALE
jgi:medium-chain acyl-[acyl-carrier-protein] hydrolase